MTAKKSNVTVFLDPRLKNELRAYGGFNQAFRDDGWALVCASGKNDVGVKIRHDGVLITHNGWKFGIPLPMIFLVKSYDPQEKETK